MGIQPFGNYNRALNGMEMASIGFSWMETNTVEKKMIPASPQADNVARTVSGSKKRSSGCECMVGPEPEMR